MVGCDLLTTESPWRDGRGVALAQLLDHVQDFLLSEDALRSSTSISTAYGVCAIADGGGSIAHSSHSEKFAANPHGSSKYLIQ